ncbi:unnamed protein product [Sphagnum jensenii]|uniref:C-terminal of Roc (COR) domain-containing protein n=1 Tax=Sphagnum jensenii TaxID=128206 RepID=A0ABP1B2P8_9BRYO
MEAGECSKEIDPGDTELGRSPTERQDSGNGATNAIENMPQDPSRPEMANEINMSSGDRCDERKKMMEQPGSEGVAHESDDLLILGDQPTSYTKTPVSTISQEDPVFVSYDEGFVGSTKYVSIDEFITTVRESQLESLRFSCVARNYEVGSSRWNRNLLEVIEAVSTCESLKTLTIQNRLDVEEVEVLCENLVSHPMLATLGVGITAAGTSGDGVDKEMEILCNMLKNNRTIKTLSLWLPESLTEIGVASLGAMLSVNSTLENLHVFPPGHQTEIEVVLAPLTGHYGKPPLNKSLKTLTLTNLAIGQREARAAAQMLRTNDSLTHLGLAIARFSDPLDVCTILESLETNETLHTLGLSGCEAVGGDVVLAKMMDLLRDNPWLKDIGLDDTPLQRDGRAVQVKAQLEMNSRDYMAVVKGMRRVQPKFATVFLCGDGYSGKTTLRRSMVRSFLQGFQGKMVIPLIEEVELHKPFKGFCFNNDPDEMAKRTRGIQINVLVDDEDKKISIWDLAGQEEYHAFHDTMIPDLSIQGNVCYFVLVCSPFDRKNGQKKDPNDIHDEIHCWLRFISSNTKRSLNSPPQVLVVLTNGDKGFQDDKDLVETRLRDLKQKFAAFVDLSPICHLINAHSSREAKVVVKEVMQNCASILKKVPHIYEACMKVQHGLSEWNRKHPHEPIVTMKGFENDIVDKVEPNLRNLEVEGESNLKPHVAIAMFLHDASEVIYFKDEDFVVVNPNWFCNEVMGRLITLHGDVKKAGWKQIFQDGHGNIEDIQNLIKISLKKIICDRTNIANDIPKYLVCLMLKMHLAYSENNPNVDQNGQNSMRIFVPTTLKPNGFVARGERSLEWTFNEFPPETNIIHLGRRLQCYDQELTTFTPGFFPRAQVALYNHFVKHLRPKANSYKSEKNLSKILIDGMEIFVELAGDEMKSHLFIDILVRSSKTKSCTLQFIEDHLLSQIEQLCSAPQVGCQGIALMRGILRPKVVQNLLVCKDRKHQIVLVEDLKQDLLATNLDTSYVHTWKEVPNEEDCNVNFFGGGMEDTAISLLGEVDTHEVFQRRYRALKELEGGLTMLQENNTSFENYSQDFQNEVKMDSNHVQQHINFPNHGNATSQHLVESICNAIVPVIEEKLQSMEKRLQTSMEEIKQGIQSTENRLHNVIKMGLDNSINLSLQLQQRQVPCNVYFTTMGSSGQRKLIVKMLPGIQLVRLHLLCEHIEGIHVVKNQKGEEITLIDPKMQKWVPYLVTGLTIFSLLLKVGAHVVAGIGDMIPNFGKGLSLALDTNALQDYFPSDGIQKILEHESFEGKRSLIEQGTALNKAQEKNSVEQWLVHFLKEKKKSISESFGLTRVKYHKKNNQGPLIRWVC